MKRFAFAVGLLALGSAAATPARADYAVVRFETGYCQIWWDAGDVPVGSQLDQGRHHARLGVGLFLPVRRDRRQNLQLKVL